MKPHLLDTTRAVFMPFLAALLLGATLLAGCGKSEPPAPPPTGGSSNGAAVSTSDAPLGRDRIALLIGNAGYDGEWKLGNPANDAADYAAALTRAGFQVEVKKDLDRDGMIEAISAFGKKAMAIQGIAVFYYAGHGMAREGTNYLLPVSIRPDADATGLVMAGINANQVLELLGKSAGRVNVAIFDMCRNLPSRGLRGSGGEGGLVRMEASAGSLLAFSTAFGERAKDGVGQRNSPYARQLIAQLETPGLTVTDYFNFVRQGVRKDTGEGQIPEETSRLEGLAPPLVPGAARPAVTATAGDSGEVAFWNSVKDSGRAEELKLYLEKYPNGQFAGLARVRVKGLEGAPAGAPAAVAAPPASSGQRPVEQVFKDCADCPEMVVIPSGRFDMGSAASEADRDNDEGPVHSVSVRTYALGKTEVTQRQWRSVMGSDPPELYFKGCDECPVDRVSWNDAQEYVKKLSEKTGKRYRLPSEAEWEYACRGGRQQRYCGGDEVGAVAWYDGNSGSKTHAVGGKQANAFGLYDMSGNVYEWVQDCKQPNYSGAPSDGSAWENCGGDVGRVLRGGSWDDLTRGTRAANRFDNAPGSRNFSSGFRPARTLP